MKNRKGLWLTAVLSLLTLASCGGESTAGRYLETHIDTSVTENEDYYFKGVSSVYTTDNDRAINRYKSIKLFDITIDTSSEITIIEKTELETVLKNEKKSDANKVIEEGFSEFWPLVEKLPADDNTRRLDNFRAVEKSFKSLEIGVSVSEGRKDVYIVGVAFGNFFITSKDEGKRKWSTELLAVNAQHFYLEEGELKLKEYANADMTDFLEAIKNGDTFEKLYDENTKNDKIKNFQDSLLGKNFKNALKDAETRYKEKNEKNN